MTIQGNQTRSHQTLPLVHILFKYSLNFLVTKSTLLGLINQGLIIFRKKKNNEIKYNPEASEIALQVRAFVAKHEFPRPTW